MFFFFALNPVGVGPSPFSFFAKTVLPSDKKNMSHFFKEMAPQDLTDLIKNELVFLLL